MTPSPKRGCAPFVGIMDPHALSLHSSFQKQKIQDGLILIVLTLGLSSLIAASHPTVRNLTNWKNCDSRSTATIHPGPA